MEGNRDSYSDPVKEANSYPTLQLTRSNEGYANEGQLRFKNELTNLEGRHGGPSTYWKNEPFWNSPCRLSPDHSLVPDDKLQSKTQKQKKERKQDEYLAIQPPPSPGISIDTRADPESSRPDLTLCRMGSAPDLELGSVRGSVKSSRLSFDDAVTYDSDSPLIFVENELSVDPMH
jgi:hypothetical protein